MGTLRFVFWTLIAISFVLGIAGLAEAQDDTKELVCINGWVSDNQAHYIELAAQEMGFRTYHAKRYEHVKGCAVYFIRGDDNRLLVRGKGAPLALFQGMSKSKAKRLLSEYLLFKLIPGQCTVNGGEPVPC